MKVSTKGRYALLLMLDLTIYNTGEPVRLRDVAGRQQISEKYLEHIISVLNKAGYVRSIRGPQGGYMLRNAPESYTVGMILRLTEGSLSPVGYLEEDCPERRMATMRVWQMLGDAIDTVVDHITLRDLADWQTEQSAQYII